MKIDTDSFVLAVDVDGVQADYESGLAKIVAADRNVSFMPPSLDWGFSNWGLKEGEFMKYHTELIETGGFRELPAIPGVAEKMKLFSDLGIYTRVVTHRLVIHGHHKQIIGDTAEWLDRNGILYRDICFAANKATVGADLYIDDAPHNYAALVEAGIPCILFDQAYNQDVDAPLRAKDWDEVEKLVMKVYNEWKRK